MDILGSFKNLFGGGGKSGGGGKRLKRIVVDKRFDLSGRAGQGSMSKTWRAYDKELGRTVCLKVLDKEKTKKFEDRFPGLKRPSEGVILTSLHHKNIVKTYEHGITNKGEQYLIMELIDGIGLNFLVETNAPQIRGKRIEYLVQICSGLEHMHNQGYLHRDICPRNIMVTHDDIVKLIDFGLSIPNKPDFCKPGNRTGTPDYLAPEVIGRKTTDHRVDLFALGVTAYEMFTRNLPWEKAESMQILLSHLNNPGKDPREFKPDLDDKTVRFLNKAIERDPKMRFQTAAEFRAAARALPPA